MTPLQLFTPVFQSHWHLRVPS